MNTLRFPLLLASFLLAACGNVVVTGGNGAIDGTGGHGPTGGTGGHGNGDSSGASTSPPSLAAAALTRAQDEILWEEYWSTHDPSGTTTSSGGGNLDPNDLFLRLSDLGVSCDSPTVNLSCGGHYEMSIVLPPALQHVGVYSLQDPEIVKYSFMSETGELNSSDPEDCPWGGGSLDDGSLEIISIDETEVHFKLTMPSGIWDTDPSGEYTAPRCPSSP